MNLTPTAPIYADRYHDAHLMIYFETGSVHLDGTPIRLSAKCYALLAYLARHAGQLLSRENLLFAVWGYAEGVRTRTLDVHIRRLRQCLGAYGSTYIETIFGEGYRFQPARPQSALVATAGTTQTEWRVSFNGQTPN